MLQTAAMHAVMCDPKPTLIVHMTSTDRNAWVEEKFDPMVQNSPEIRARLGKGREDSTFSRQRFRGMRITLGYPTAQTFSSHSYGAVLMTDYDHFRQVLGPADRPEGKPWDMALNRIRTYMSRGKVLAESTPAFPAFDPTWRQPADAPHMMPPTEGGIVLLYNDGTRGRWYWECPDCQEEFEPRFDRLRFDPDLEPGAAGAGAQMECPHCGVLIDHRHKVEINRAALRDKGGWRHEGADGTLAAFGDARLRETDTASFALNGAAATFSSWREIVAKYVSAMRQFRELDDDTELATFHYTFVGVPHVRPSGAGEGELTIQALRDAALPLPKGVAPSWTRFVTITVDVQSSWFPVQVTAWDERGNAVVIDRFDLTAPPEGAPNAARDADGTRRRLQPGVYAEDWRVLEALETRVIPLEGQGYGLKPVALAVDFQGEPGVSDNAEAFWKARRKAGSAARWLVSRGEGGFKVPFRVVHEQPDRASKGKKARNIKILKLATDRLKDTVSAALARGVAGAQGAIHLGAWMTEETAVAEFIAEERTVKGWELKRGQRRNEGLDLTVQARALAEHLGLMKINPDAPPPWAVGGLENTHAVELTTDDSNASGMANDKRAAKTDAPSQQNRPFRGIAYLS
jgi:phage terminase large subunit GpA-like protein